MSNITFGTGNVINPTATNSLAGGDNNEIQNGNANFNFGSKNVITNGNNNFIDGVSNNITQGNSHYIIGNDNEISGSDPNNSRNYINGFGNTILKGSENILTGYTNEILPIPTTDQYFCINNNINGSNNILHAGQGINIDGRQNTVIDGNGANIEGLLNVLNSGFNIHVEGRSNIIGYVGNPSDYPTVNHRIENSHVQGFGNKLIFSGMGNETISRKGADMTGYKGYFLYNQTKTSAEDTYNYSNQLAGGGGKESLNIGEGISMIDRTIVNGTYPLGKHQTYVNTSDGTNYAVTMKSNRALKIGTFVSLSTKCNYCCKDLYEKMLVSAKNNKQVIGVITEAAGFIANAGQFAASERIEYDKFDSPIIKLNLSPSSLVSNLNEENNIKYKINENVENIKNENVKSNILQYPAFLTVIKSDIDRSIPFTPFNERPNYYQVALLGLVVVRAKFTKKELLCNNKCDVNNGVAIPGNKYWISKIIDKKHLQIILK